MQQKMSKKEMFMINKLSVTLCDLPINIFLPNGFFDFSAKPGHLHRHRYVEVHVVCDGNMEYAIGSNKYVLNKGDFLIIPSHKMHSCVFASLDIKHSAFLIDAEVPDTIQSALPCGLIEQIPEDILNAREKGNYFELLGFFSLILSKAITDKKVCASDICDDSFIIDNYIEKHYADRPSLTELAVRLRRSEKQAARLVRLYYGMSFSDLILQKRMRTAAHLKRTTDMSMRDISEYVGYNSYSGFYKAYKHFFEE